MPPPHAQLDPPLWNEIERGIAEQVPRIGRLLEERSQGTRNGSGTSLPETAQRRTGAALDNLLFLSALSQPREGKDDMLRLFIAQSGSKACAPAAQGVFDWDAITPWLRESSEDVRRLFVKNLLGPARGIGAPANIPARPVRPFTMRFGDAFASRMSHERPPVELLQALEAVGRRHESASLDQRLVCRALGWWAQHVLRKPAEQRQQDVDALLFEAADGELDRGMDILRDRAALPVAVLDRMRSLPGYPVAGVALEIQGRTRVRVVLDKEGVPLQADVVERDLDLRWLGDDPPLLFERLFDRAAIARAMARTYPKAPGPQPPDEREFF